MCIYKDSARSWNILSLFSVARVLFGYVLCAHAVDCLFVYLFVYYVCSHSDCVCFRYLVCFVVVLVTLSVYFLLLLSNCSHIGTIQRIRDIFESANLFCCEFQRFDSIRSIFQSNMTRPYSFRYPRLLCEHFQHAEHVQKPNTCANLATSPSVASNAALFFFTFVVYYQFNFYM